ncbi:transglutaminase family protein [Cellulomonas bogoriensis]|uniref:transglutaminase family protein n=1 Tax=Cellulomonas bogoriensis TaxID=301388 RepID=UPI000AEB15E3|nr:transglutaminase domain-containing protein [Cellulomonas bogoriensis]
MSPVREWAGPVLTGTVVIAGAVGMSSLVRPDGWLVRVTVLVAALAITTALVRRRARSQGLPTMVATAVGAVVLWAWFAPAGLATPPGPDAMGHLLDLWGEGVRHVVGGRIPVTAGPGLALIVTCATVGLFLVSDLVAWGGRRPGLAGVVLAVPWVVVAAFERSPSGLALAVAAAGYLLTLAAAPPVEAPGPRTASTPGPAPTAVLAGATAVAALLLAPVLATLPGAGTWALPSIYSGRHTDAPVRLSTDLDMQTDLVERSDRPVLRYRSSDGAPYVLRLATLAHYESGRWRRDLGGGPDADARDGLLWPEHLEGGTEDALVIDVLALDERRVPLPVEPRRFDSPFQGRYVPQRDEVLGRVQPGSRISLSVAHRDLDPEHLRSDSPGRPADGREIPPDLGGRGAEIATLTREITAGARTAYDQALALQEHFRTGGGYEYSEQVPEPAGDEPVWEFLNERVGYCVQYATAMAVMAQTLDIPARLGVGFLPGEPNADGTYVVRARHAHAWPELYFEDAGWVRFEPTPSVQAGSPPPHAAPAADADEVEAEPQVTPDDAPGPEPDGAPDVDRAEEDPSAADEDDRDQGGEPQAGPGAEDEQSTPWPAVLLVTTLALAGGAAAWLLRTRSRRHGPRGVEHAWQRLRRELARHDLAWPASTSPRAARALLEPHLGPTGHEAMGRLVHTLEQVRYRPGSQDGEEPPTARLDAWVDAITRDLRPAATTPTPSDGGSPERQ